MSNPKTKQKRKPALATRDAVRINRESFTIRALRLVRRLDDHCRDQGLHAYLHEEETWNPHYDSDVKLLMGEAFEIMKLQNFAHQNGLVWDRD